MFRVLYGRIRMECIVTEMLTMNVDEFGNSIKEVVCWSRFPFSMIVTMSNSSAATPLHELMMLTYLISLLISWCLLRTVTSHSEQG